ncbi:hypothetical protein DXG01_001387 [Tephrocybe rancida]|nr:hypothetical protein DXG01_001387 [Tephrocybe rancida]
MEGFKIHARVLIGAYTHTSIPELPNAHLINTFEQRFSDSETVERLLKGTTLNASFRSANQQVKKDVADLRKKCLTDRGSKIAMQIAQIPDDTLEEIFSLVHSFGLPSWRPDLTGTPTSLYNLDTELVRKLYRNFVYSYMKGLFLKEAKVPGSVVEGSNGNKVYKNREKLTQRRHMYLKDNGWNSQVQMLAGRAECTSDSEPNPDGGFYIVPKRARSANATAFLRQTDLARGNQPLFGRQRQTKYKEEPRTAHPNPDYRTEISERLPRTCPLDWFDPAYFNVLDIKFRAMFANSPIALPPVGEGGGSNPDWKNMPRAEFMAKYGDRV